MEAAVAQATTAPWLDLKHAEARRGTEIIQRVDPNLKVAYVAWAPPEAMVPPRSFVLLGPSNQHRGLVIIERFRDTLGRPLRFGLPWERIAHEIRVRYEEHLRGIYLSQKIEAANDEKDRKDTAVFDEEVSAMLDYAEPAMLAELNGASRHPAQDVLDGWNAASEGQKPAPRGQVISIPKETS